MNKTLYFFLCVFFISCIKKPQYYKTEELIESDHKLLGNNMKVEIDSFMAKNDMIAIKEGYKRYLISVKVREDEISAQKSGTYKKVKNFSLFSPEGILLNFNKLNENQKDSIKMAVEKAVESSKIFK